MCTLQTEHVATFCKPETKNLEEKCLFFSQNFHIPSTFLRRICTDNYNRFLYYLVYDEVGFTLEPFATGAAHVIVIASVPGFVLRQPDFGSERLFAHGTVEWLFSSVFPHVLRQLVVGSVLLAALNARLCPQFSFGFNVKFFGFNRLRFF